MSSEAIESALLSENQARCLPPLPEDEVRKIAESVSRYKPSTKQFPLTDSGNAEVLAALYGDTLRYDHHRKRWLTWNGHYWGQNAAGEVQRLALAGARWRQRTAADIDDVDQRKLAFRWGVQSESSQRRAAALVAGTVRTTHCHR